MVAGDTKRVVVIKNIASNLIEEAILILRSEPGAGEENRPVKQQTKDKADMKNDFILKEAEKIIGQYIKEKGLLVPEKKHRYNGALRDRTRTNKLINGLLIASTAFLLLVVLKLLL